MPFNLLVLVCVTYVVGSVPRGLHGGTAGAAWGVCAGFDSPLVYTLSLSIYCTAWTFYGAVGYAARSGLEFVTIYLGPTLVFVGWWWVLRKLVRIGRQQRITSIADLISSRYGKSNLLGVIVTLIAVVAATPYIALQLQSVTLSFGVFASATPDGWALPDRAATAIWVAVGLALFTILFGTRNLDANEQPPRHRHRHCRRGGGQAGGARRGGDLRRLGHGRRRGRHVSRGSTHRRSRSGSCSPGAGPG